MSNLTLDTTGWIDCSTQWRAPFLPASTGTWATYPALEDLFIYNGSGVMPGRTWIISPDPESLKRRWQMLIEASIERKEDLFHPHLRKGKPGDKHIKKVVAKALPGFSARSKTIAEEAGDLNNPIRYGFRSFDRQWIIPDNRLINQPNPELWELLSERQVYLTAPSDRSPTSGPALTFTALVPDLHHYNGRGGRVFPLWLDRAASVPNVPENLLLFLTETFKRSVHAEDLLAYIAAVASHPEFTERFTPNLVQPGLRIPLTANEKLFFDTVDIGRNVIWLYTFGERFVDVQHGRPAGPPRLPETTAPRIPLAGAIPQDSGAVPDTLEYGENRKRLLIGAGYVEHVTAEMWDYEISGKNVLRQWFSYRKANRERPIIGDRRQPSKLGEIQPSHWLAEYTTELINLLNILGWLVGFEPWPASMLEKICSGPTISVDELRTSGALGASDRSQRRNSRSQKSPEQTSLLP